jgi:hypothetical protein
MSSGSGPFSFTYEDDLRHASLQDFREDAG